MLAASLRRVAVPSVHFVPERHSCPADRGPNSSSLYPPQAAVVAVAHFFCASPIYGSAEDFTSLLNFTPCKSVTPAAKQRIGETRKKRLAKRLAFFRFDYSFGV